MRIAVTSRGPGLNDEVDPRFGRASYILIYDETTQALEVVDNSANVQAFKGAGIQAATMVSDKGVSVLLTGYCGPNAFTTLEAGGVKVVSDVAGTVEEALALFKEGKLTFSESANAEAHW
jgi:predicted Fe-Mo cluster-binding NifX family protein